MTDPNQDHSTGRRSYDVEIAELKFQVHDLKEEVKELRGDIKDLLEAWKSAKGISSFIKWAAGISIAVGVLSAKAKGWWPI